VLALAVGSTAAARAMRACRAEGQIVNVSSSSTRLEAPGFYGATKTDLVADAASQYKRLVRDVLTEAVAAGELDLEPAGLTADTAAELLIGSARGLQSSAASPAAYRRYLKALVLVIVTGLSSADPSRARSRPQA
jgi:NAD(P)-dependent dehydrogenase (short-subunit alcohol dehydrogenase family)